MSIPAKLQQIMDEFASVPQTFRSQVLLDYAKKLPPLPAEYATHPEMLQPVPECTSPVSLAVRRNGSGYDLIFKVPEESPTIKGFAGILHAALSGADAETILGVPDDFYMQMGMPREITPMRLRGMGGVLMRIKNAVRSAEAEG